MGIFLRRKKVEPVFLPILNPNPHEYLRPCNATPACSERTTVEKEKFQSCASDDNDRLFRSAKRREEGSSIEMSKHSARWESTRRKSGRQSNRTPDEKTKVAVRTP